MIKQHISGLFAAPLLAMNMVNSSVRAAAPAPAETSRFADLADLALPAEIVAKVRISEAIAVKPEPGTAPANGRIRLYVQGVISALMKGPPGTSPSIAFLADLPLDVRGRAPRIKKSVQLVFARSVPNRSGYVQLDAPDSVLEWSEQRESLARSILAASAAPDSPPRILGLDNGFSVAGTVTGERETQIFLLTNQRPVSITVTHRPGEAVRWSVALGEIADQGAPPPPRDTLLWYALACTLPLHFPAAKLAGQTAEAAAAITADYDLVMRDLGACTRGM